MIKAFNIFNGDRQRSSGGVSPYRKWLQEQELQEELEHVRTEDEEENDKD